MPNPEALTDVELGAAALRRYVGTRMKHAADEISEICLDAVLPTHDEALLLKMADEWDRWGHGDVGFGDWLRREAAKRGPNGQ